MSIIAQVSVGLAGFASVTVMLGRGPGRWQPADAFRIRALLYGAFGALFVSLVPIALLLGGVAEDVSIRCGAVALFLLIALSVINVRRALGRLDESSRAVFRPRAGVVLVTITALAAAAQLVTALGFAGRAGGGFFFFGLAAQLGNAAFSFVRLMFVRPGEED